MKTDTQTEENKAQTARWEASRTPGTPEHADGQRRLMEAIFPTDTQTAPTFDQACNHPAIQEVLSERDKLKAQADKLAEALREILPLAKHMNSCRDGGYGIEKCNCGAQQAVPAARKALAEYEGESEVRHV